MKWTKKYDNKSVKITYKFGNIYDAICYYYSSEYNEHELGINEDSLSIKALLKK